MHLNKVLGITIIICSQFLIISCGKLSEVEIQGADNFKYVGFKDNYVTFQADIKVNNPSHHKITVKEINAKLLVNDIYLGRLQNDEVIHIMPLSDDYITVSFRLRIANVLSGLSTIARLYNQKNLKVEVNGYVIARTALYRKKINISETTRINSIR